MNRFIKIKNLIICLIVLVLLTSVTAGAVSYAKWVAPNQTLNASLSIGSWEEKTKSDYPNGIVYVNDKGVTKDIEIKQEQINAPIDASWAKWKDIYIRTMRDDIKIYLSLDGIGTGGIASNDYIRYDESDHSLTILKAGTYKLTAHKLLSWYWYDASQATEQEITENQARIIVLQ